MRAQLLHLSGPLRGRTDSYATDQVLIGTEPPGDVGFPDGPRGMAERPAEDALQRQSRPAATALGVRVESVTGETAKDLGIEERDGALVVDVMEGGAGDEAGVRRGDVIKEVNDRPVNDTLEYDAAVQRARERNPQKPIVLLVKRGDSTRFIAVQPEE